MKQRRRVLPTQRVYACLPRDRFTTISVGSGLGTREYALDPKIICVDPDPLAWQTNDQKLPTLLPHYPTVKDMLTTRKGQAYVGDCVLCLFHPYPSPKSEDEKELYQSAGYDWQAIQLLQPLFVFLLLVLPNNSGSDELWSWLNKQEYQKQNYVRMVDFTSQEELDPTKDNKNQFQVRYILLVKRSCIMYLNKYNLIQCSS